MHTRAPTPRLAFSLVELSIVLVILGLLVGGVLAGQSLIRAAELRAVSAEYSRFVAATQSFRDKYFAIPGDMSNATRFWGRFNSNADCVTNSSAAVATPGACDGNGDGIMGLAAAANQSGEIFQFWRQLATAGLIEGNYTGLAGSASLADSNRSNSPPSKLGNAGWSTWFRGNVGDTTDYALEYGNAYVFGALNSGGLFAAAALKPEEAWNIDTKLDDGKPASGKLIARFWNNACAVADDGSSANNDLAASYKLSDTTMQCALFFRQAF